MSNLDQFYLIKSNSQQLSDGFSTVVHLQLRTETLKKYFLAAVTAAFGVSVFGNINSIIL